jgi:hypothetical protein
VRAVEDIMKKLFFFIGLFSLGASLNIPLLLRNEEVLVTTRSTDNGWKQQCVYYKPFEVRTIEIPHYQRCEKVRQEDTTKRPGSFFWEQKA